MGTFILDHRARHFSQRIADVITDLKTEGKIEVVTVPQKGGKKVEIEYWYEVKVQRKV